MVSESCWQVVPVVPVVPVGRGLNSGDGAATLRGRACRPGTNRQGMTMSDTNGNRGSVLSGSIMMIVISLLLFWLPGIGGFISGVVGGKASGGVGAALAAWLLSSLLFGALFAVFGTLLSGMIVIGFVAGLGGLLIAFIDAGARLLGAIIGGVFA